MIIYGTHPVEEVLELVPDRIHRLISSRWGAKELARIAELSKANGVKVDHVPGPSLDELVDGNHQGIAAELHPFNYAPLERVIERTAENPHACVLVLDQVQDPQNFGSILRSAAGLGIDAVIVPKDRAASVTGVVVRASAGLAFRVPVVQVTNVARCLDELKEHGFWTVGAFMDGTPAWDIDFRMKTALVMGSEQKGIRPLVERKCDFRTSIPMKLGTESLNVGVASAILLYEIKRQCK